MLKARTARRILLAIAVTVFLTAIGPAQGASGTDGGQRRNAQAADEVVAGEPQRDASPPAAAAQMQPCPELPRDGVRLCVSPASPEEVANVPVATPSTVERAAAAAAAPPDWCFDHINDGFWMTRISGCEISTDYKVEASRCTGGTCTVEGQIIFDIWQYAYTSYTSGEWVDYVELPIRHAWGVLAQPGATVRGYVSPGSSCEFEHDDDFPSQVPTVGSVVTGSSTFTAPTLAGGGRVSCFPMYWAWVWEHPVAGVSNLMLRGIPRVRCDQDMPATTTQGCVFTYYWPDLIYRHADYPELVDHIFQVQYSGLPGHPNGTPLHRLTGSLVDRNRDTACPSRYPRPTGKTCDEYPFASTHEGAYTGGGQPRTPPWCQITLSGPPSTGPTGYSVCMIDETDNELGGVDLASFYRNFRILDGDPFFVDVSG